MAATIRFADGVEATLIDQNGTWVCDDPMVKEQLEIITRLLPWAYYTDRIGGLAGRVAEEAGAEVVHMDPPPARNDPDRRY